MKRWFVVMLVFLVSFNIQAQYQETTKSKREIRKEKKRLKEVKLEEGRQIALKALKEKDFALRLTQFTNPKNEFMNVVDDTNGLIINGDDIYIYQGDAPQSYAGGWDDLNFQGKIEKMRIEEDNEDKRFDAALYVTNTHFPKPMTVFLKMFGDNVEARLVFGSDRYRMRGRFERASEAPYRAYPMLVPGFGRTGY